ncbi:hypothetical protein HCN44_001343 [Aphidius gifuensis]|uniref:TOG domain-containing protein n=1 Tax=Aphidius gifuensis TaxID=684658 RepID=A0A834XY22_APHGI|nr:hypothetical protein HCN44_001343 [Aphidius gifuensis]
MEIIEKIDINDIIPRVDISGQITESLLAELHDKNWKIRNEGLKKISTILTETKFIKGNIGELPRALSPRLTDSNTKIAQSALGICENIATAMGPPIKQHIRVLFSGFVQCLGDSKNWIRAAAISCMNTWGDQSGYKEFFDEELVICLPHLHSNLEDRNSYVCKYAQEAAIGFMTHLSYKFMVRQTEKLKPGSKTVVIAGLDKARPRVPITTSKPISARKKDDDIDTSPLLAVNNLKHQRVIDEQKLNVHEWNFTTPRKEFVELLKKLMSSAGRVNKSLIANMFHSDFRYHLKAIESLTEVIPNNILLKGLDYLQTVFNLLIQDNYHMMENEAACFIPYLILEMGDPKNAVRNGVRGLFKQIASVYPVSKLFTWKVLNLKMHVKE